MTPILVSCAEASGDLLASGVIAAIRKQHPEQRFVGIAGARSRAAGAEPAWDVGELSVMGIAEVLPKLRRILQILDGLEELSRREKPQVALLVDAPDFNLRLAKRLKKQGIRVVYYVSPTVWAWRQGRVKTIAKVVDEMCCILPFEEPWYRARGVQARFVGHPLLEQQPAPGVVEQLREELLAGGKGPLLAILPGSRGMEIRTLLPTMLESARRVTAQIPSVEVVLPIAPTIKRSVIEAYCAKAGFTPKLVEGRAREVLGACDAALVASGTATLEATLARAPMVVAYRAAWLTAFIFRLIVRAKHVSLPNILAGKTIVPELLQESLSAESLTEAVLPLLQRTPQRAQMVERLSRVRDGLGTPGASERVAQALLAPALPAGARGVLPAGG